jgi:hypothetical protein
LNKKGWNVGLTLSHMSKEGEMVINETPTAIEEVPSSRSCRWWLFLIWGFTDWIPSFVLHYVSCSILPSSFKIMHPPSMNPFPPPPMGMITAPSHGQWHQFCSSCSFTTAMTKKISIKICPNGGIEGMSSCCILLMS